MKVCLDFLLVLFHTCSFYLIIQLQWRHNGRDCVSNHQPRDCLLHRLFRCRSKITSKLLGTVLSAGNSPVTGEFPAQMASNAENVSIWWPHYDWWNISGYFPMRHMLTKICILSSCISFAFIMFSQYKYVFPRMQIKDKTVRIMVRWCLYTAKTSHPQPRLIKVVSPHMTFNYNS